MQEGARIREIALDSLEKLTARAMLQQAIDTLLGEESLEALVQEITDSVCSSYTYEILDEKVQLQTLKFLLTAITSKSLQVHSSSLLKVIETCFNIHVNSKNIVNQTTAKATLTQIINFVMNSWDICVTNSKSPQETEVCR